MAEIQTSSWSETAASNNSATPDGWPENQSYASVNDCAREMMAAIKREWNRSHPSVVAGGTADALTLTYTTAPPAYVAGMLFTFYAGAAVNTVTTPTLNVNTLGAKTIKRSDGNALAAGEIVAGAVVQCIYNGTDMLMLPPHTVPKTGGTFTGKISAPNGTSGTEVVNYSQFAATLAATGSRVYPDGSIEKWGTATLPASGGSTSSVAVSFAAAFPTAIFVVKVTPVRTVSAGGGNAICNAESATTAGFTVYADTNVAAVHFDRTVNVYWEAKGN